MTRRPRQGAARRRAAGAALTALALLVSVVGAGWSQAEDSRRIMGGRNLEIRYWPEHEEIALLVREASLESLKLLEDYLDMKVDRTILVEIVRSHREFEERVGRPQYRWILGVSRHHGNHVILKPLTGDRMRRLVIHELSHVALDMKMRPTMGEPPRWLHEGLAQWMEGELPAARQDVLGRAVVGRELLGFDELEQAFSGQRDMVDLAYAQAYTLVAFMVEHGPSHDTLGRFLQYLMDTGDERLALQRAMGQPLEAAERRWLQQVRTDYVARGVPLSMELVIFGLMGMLFIVAVIIRMGMARQIRREMQQEERLEDLMRGIEVDDEDEPWEPEQGEGTWDEEEWDDVAWDGLSWEEEEWDDDEDDWDEEPDPDRR